MHPAKTTKRGSLDERVATCGVTDLSSESLCRF